MSALTVSASEFGPAVYCCHGALVAALDSFMSHPLCYKRGLVHQRIRPVRAHLGSHKPEAKRLKHWVTSEVLPEIRKTGQYTAGQKSVRATSAMALGIHGVMPALACA